MVVSYVTVWLGQTRLQLTVKPALRVYPESTRELSISQDQWRRFVNGEGLVQNVFPELDNETREWIISGIDGETWAKIFEPDEQLSAGQSRPSDSSDFMRREG